MEKNGINPPKFGGGLNFHLYTRRFSPTQVPSSIKFH
jgi:hypothetical protein